MVGWMDGWIDGWMDGWMVGWMAGWMDSTTQTNMSSNMYREELDKHLAFVPILKIALYHISLVTRKSLFLQTSVNVTRSLPVLISKAM